MTASPDDAAASDFPLRADVGPAAPSFRGTPGRRRPEDHHMAQHSPASDETVRMRPDDADGRPPLGSPGAAGWGNFDDTRPVPRDWLSGAPDSGRAEQPPAPAPAPAVADPGPAEPAADATSPDTLSSDAPT